VALRQRLRRGDPRWTQAAGRGARRRAPARGRPSARRGVLQGVVSKHARAAPHARHSRRTRGAQARAARLRGLMQRGQSAFLALLLGTLCLARFLGEGALSLYVLFALTAIVTVGISLLMGQAGQVSLGQGAFYAGGAYTAGVLTTHGCPGAVA